MTQRQLEQLLSTEENSPDARCKRLNRTFPIYFIYSLLASAFFLMMIHSIDNKHKVLSKEWTQHCNQFVKVFSNKTNEVNYYSRFRMHIQGIHAGSPISTSASGLTRPLESKDRRAASSWRAKKIGQSVQNSHF